MLVHISQPFIVISTSNDGEITTTGVEITPTNGN